LEQIYRKEVGTDQRERECQCGGGQVGFPDYVSREGGGGSGGGIASSVRRISIRCLCVLCVPLPAEQANLPSKMKGHKGEGVGLYTTVYSSLACETSSLLTEDRVGKLSPAMGRGINSRNRVWNLLAKHRLAGRYDNPMPTWFLAPSPIAGLKLPTQASSAAHFVHWSHTQIKTYLMKGKQRHFVSGNIYLCT
jgi:hypothetical protein